MNTNDGVSVECYSGHAYAQEPRAFVFDNERRTVTRVYKRWREPAGPRFRVLADDAGTYVLAYDEAADRWQVSAAEVNTSLRRAQTHNDSKDGEDGQR